MESESEYSGFSYLLFILILLDSLVWEQIQLKTLRPDMKTICQARIAGDTIFVLGCATYINTLEEDCEVLTYKIGK